MKIFTSLTFASVLLISACTGTSQHQGANASKPMTGATMPASTQHTYQCESGQTIAAAYPSSDLATVQYKGSSHRMQIAVSGSGARYTGGNLEWWTKGSGAGSEGTLFRHNADDTSGEILERCKQP